jgi:tetratricopeptide (TPR) repeat protein
MLGKPLHGRLLGLGTLLFLTLTAAAPAAFPAPQNRTEALAALENSVTERRAEAVVWIANHGAPEDEALLFRRLREDESPFVREFAERGLRLLWSRSGDAALDRLLAQGSEHMEAGRHEQAIDAFSQVIRRKPGFAEGWNLRATAYYLTGEYQRSLADCDEVIKRNPRHFGALAGYGQIYFNLEQYEKALEYWRRALEVNPNMLGVKINIQGVQDLLEQRRKRAI